MNKAVTEAAARLAVAGKCGFPLPDQVRLMSELLLAIAESHSQMARDAQAFHARVIKMIEAL